MHLRTGREEEMAGWLGVSSGMLDTHKTGVHSRCSMLKAFLYALYHRSIGARMYPPLGSLSIAGAQLLLS